MQRVTQVAQAYSRLKLKTRADLGSLKLERGVGAPSFWDWGIQWLMPRVSPQTYWQQSDEVYLGAGDFGRCSKPAHPPQKGVMPSGKMGWLCWNITIFKLEQLI